MKTLIYSLLVFSLILSTSCSKESSLTPDVKPDTKTITKNEQTGITLANLVGKTFNCVSVYFDGVTYSPTINLKEFNDFDLTHDFVTLDFKFISNTQLKLSTNYGENGKYWEYDKYEYALSNNIITIETAGIDYLVFEITNASTYNGTTLNLKMTKGNLDMPVGGTYNLKKI